MSKSVRLLILFALAVVLLWGLFAVLTDPAGVFGDPLMDWWAYDMTVDPQGAKVRYVAKHPEYDSFILGSGGSYDTAVLGGALDASFYDLGFDAAPETLCDTARWILEDRAVKYLFLDLRFSDAAPKAQQGRPDRRVSGESAFAFYGRALLHGPKDGLLKLKRALNKSVLVPYWCQYVPETGSIYGGRRDARPIPPLEIYLAREENAAFTQDAEPVSLTEIDALARAVGEIRALCDRHGTTLITVLSPVHESELAKYSEEDRLAVLNALAEQTELWDFSSGAVSREARYFYDPAHCRKAVSDLVLARILQDEDPFGGALGRYLPQGGPVTALFAPDYVIRDVALPILEYHHLTTGVPENDMTVSQTAFRDQLAGLMALGYTPVDIWQLRDFTTKGAPLPEKPILVTLDDGYESNYDLALPVLEALGCKATIFTIGISMGKDTYKDTGRAMNPHFSLEQARQMEQTGLVTVANHGYNFHEVQGLDPDPIRQGILPREGESDEDYAAFLTEDTQKMFDLLGPAAGFVSYPYGHVIELSRVVLTENGVFATVREEGDLQTLLPCLPQCLFEMPRIFVTEDYTADYIQRIISVGGILENLPPE